MRVLRTAIKKRPSKRASRVKRACEQVRRSMRMFAHQDTRTSKNVVHVFGRGNLEAGGSGLEHAWLRRYSLMPGLGGLACLDAFVAP